MRTLIVLAALSALPLAGCNQGQLSGQALADLQAALAGACPIVASVQSAVSAGTIKLNVGQSAALSTLALACPPNPPPTSGAVIAADIIQAYVVIKPLVK